jgi:TonB family protein
MSESISRTFIGSVVCVDLVGYSTRSVAQQISIKDAFNRVLGQALQHIPEDDRIILDTGDGAAISFLGDPEQSLAVGLALRDATLANAGALGAANDAQGPVRMGITLGPVKLAVDMNGYPKIIGDGLNVAERIMSFARPGQIAVSRSFFEMVSRLSDENAKLFRLEGTRTDKNAREHQVYVIDPGAGQVKAPAAATSGGLAGFLEDKLKVGSAAVLLVALILAEGALLARKWRTPVPAVAATQAPAEPAPKAAEPKPAAKAEPAAKTEPAKATPAKPPEAVPVPAPAPAPAPVKAEPRAPVEPKAEAKAAPKVEAKAEPKAAARREEPPPKPAPDAISPVQPNIVSIGELNFPAEAAARGITKGVVKARMTIDAAGNVTRVEVIRADPPRFFDEEARRSGRNWKFDRGPPNRQFIADIEFGK